MHTGVVVVTVVTVVTVVVLEVISHESQRIGHLVRVASPRIGLSQSKKAAALHLSWSASPLHNAMVVGVISTVVGVVDVVVVSVTVVGAGVGADVGADVVGAGVGADVGADVAAGVCPTGVEGFAIIPVP